MAFGIGSSVGLGWVDRLRAVLAEEAYNLELHNLAVGRRNVSLALVDLELVLQQAVPRIVVVGLSTANELLAYSQTREEAEAIKVQYTQGIAAIAQRATSAGAHLVIGGVYASNRYTTMQAEVLFSTDTALRASYGDAYIPFLDAVSDAMGHWKAGYDYNRGHPNSAGHAAMFDAIDVEAIFGPHRCTSPPPIPKWAH